MVFFPYKYFSIFSFGMVRNIAVFSGSWINSIKSWYCFGKRCFQYSWFCSPFKRAWKSFFIMVWILFSVSGVRKNFNKGNR